MLTKRVKHVNPDLGPKIAARNVGQEKEEPKVQVIEEALDLKNIPKYFSANSQVLIPKNSPIEYIMASRKIKKWIQNSDSSEYEIPTIYLDSNNAGNLDRNTVLLGTYCDKYITGFIDLDPVAEKDSTQESGEGEEDCGNPYTGYDATIQMIKPDENKHQDVKFLLFMFATPDKLLEAAERLPAIQDLAGSDVVSF
jgi:hypothetical protein